MPPKKTKTLSKTLHRAATTIVAPPVTRKIDLACGQRPREGYEGADIWDGAKHVFDILRYPWPFEDSSIAELHSSHFCEHIPMAHVDELGNHVTHGGQDAWFRFMDECYRVLVPGGWMEIIVPSGRSNRAFQDPTHRRFFVEATFGYLSLAWRKSQMLDHYIVKGDWDVNVQTTCDSVLNTKHQAVAQRELQSYWNSSIDFHARLQSRKPTEPEAVSPSK